MFDSIDLVTESLDRLQAIGFKIDGPFIQDIDQNDRNYRIVTAVIRVASELGLEVVAEGVEREEEADILRNLGAEFLQRFLFGRSQPMKFDARVMPEAS